MATEFLPWGGGGAGVSLLIFLFFFIYVQQGYWLSFSSLVVSFLVRIMLAL